MSMIRHLTSITAFAFATATLAMSTPVLAQERTTGGSLATDSEYNSVMNKINIVAGKIAGVHWLYEKFKACAYQGGIYSPKNSESNADGCLAIASNVQIGEVKLPVAYGDRNVNVVFNPPYQRVPKILTAIKYFNYWDGSNGCNVPTLTVQAEARNITTKGFTLFMHGGSYCSNLYGVHEVVWIAIDSQ
jgi:hypothetical protein